MEMRKIDGARFARFTLLDEVAFDSAEEVKLLGAMRDCDLHPSQYVGLFKQVTTHGDKSQVSIGGIDIPASAVQAFTLALSARGFIVS